ncbi:hypothetical protein ACFLZH_06110 [Patescibacteria group bacterium]
MRTILTLGTLVLTLTFSTVASADEKDDKDKNWRFSLGGFITANTDMGGGGFLSLEGDLWENKVLTFGIGGEVIFDTFNLPVNVPGLDYMRGNAFDFVFEAKLRAAPAKFIEFGFGVGLGGRYFLMEEERFTGPGNVPMAIKGTDRMYLIVPLTLHLGFRPTKALMIAVVYKPACAFGQVYEVGEPKERNFWFHRLGLQLEFLM